MSKNPPIANLDAALDTLADLLANVEFEALEEATITTARQRMFDTLAANAIGLNTPEGKALRSKGDALAPPMLSSRVAEQIRLNVGATRTTEIDDIDIASCTTVGAVVVPVALALSAAQYTDGRKLVAAVVAGYEAMIRLGRAIGGATILYRGIWPTYATAAFGAAATAAKLRGLDAATTSQALALALEGTTLPGAGAFAEPASRYDALGRAAAAGAAAAFAANEAGANVDPDALAHYAERLGVRIDIEALAHDYGSSWRIAEVDVKMFATSRQALASVEAFLSLTSELGEAEDIERIIVHVPGTYRDMVDRPELPTQRIESMIGVQYAMALALHDPEALYDALRTTLRADARIAALSAKIEVRSSSQLDTFFPQIWGSTVTVHRKSGRLVMQEVLEPAGSRTRELDWRKLGRKVARIFAASGIGNAQLVSRMLEACRILATSDDKRVATELIEAMQQASAVLRPGAGAAARS